MSANMTLSTLYEELMMEILSWLPVKSLLRFMCVSKSFQSWISDPSFVKLHLQRSPKSVHFLLKYSLDDTLDRPFILSCPAGSLFDNPLSLVADDRSLGFELNDMYEVVGCCNGLVCLFGELNNYEVGVFRVWNPATRRILGDSQLALPGIDDAVGTSGFGYDNLSDTYKLVSVVSTLNWKDGSLKSCEVKVCNMNDNNCWRSIQSFPADPTSTHGCGVYLNSTLNWITLAFPRNRNHDYDDWDVTFDELVIVSLDLRNETYTQLLLPRGLDGVHIHDFYSITRDEITSDESFGALKDCLSLFLHNRKTKRFVIWQMKEFGDQTSWTLSLNIAIQDLQIDCMSCDLLPLIMYENGGVLMIDTTYQRLRAIIYDGRENILEHCKISCNTLRIYAKNYVQSLVSLGR